MFQRFASVLFGDDVEELSRCGPGGEQGFGQKEEEEDEDWILVDYLAESCSSPCGDSLSGVPLCSHEEDEDEEEEDLVMIPSPMASPPIRYPSCTSLNSTAETDPDGNPEDEDEDVDEEEVEDEGGFLRLEACSLEESWFVTPPPCFTGRGSMPILLETSPLENLLIEHPSMSVYAHHSPPRLAFNHLPRSLNLDLGLLPANAPASPASAGGKETGRHLLDAACHRSEVPVVPRRASLHSACYAAALSAHASLLHQVKQQSGRLAQRAQPLSRNALRRLNLLRHPGGARQTKASAMYLHQPNQKHLNF